MLSRQSASNHQAHLSHKNEEDDDDDVRMFANNLEFLTCIHLLKDDLSLRGNIRSPIRPRIESKIGFVPQPPPTVLPTINLSDNEQNSRNDYSNYDSLVGSLKSDTLNWKDQQATVRTILYRMFDFFLLIKSDEDATDAESEKEIERNLTIQKEQVKRTFNRIHVYGIFIII